MDKKDSGLSLPTRLSREVDRLFDELIHRPWGFGRPAKGEIWNPQLDLYETDTAFVLEVDLPGMKQEDVSVEIQNYELVLRGQRACEHVAAYGNFYRRERQEGQFVRRLRLPASVDQGKIRVDFNDGVLRVTLPKISQAASGGKR